MSRNAITFLKTYISSPDVTGAVAPSSRGLARALTSPLREHQGAARILEVGAGTGPVTRVIGECLGPDDRLDVCEIQPELADVLERGPLSEGKLASARSEGRVRLIRAPIQEVEAAGAYDFVISGLPFTAFKLEIVQEIISVIRRSMKPGGVFSYFEYIALRALGRNLGLKSTKERLRPVSNFLDDMIATHQIKRQTIMLNIPPAYARHLVFSDSKTDGQ
ncbi:MAG: SAM-dependent methyltransferase [Phycisphaerae bacterium]|nr:MAG: SAM-dependent methyltransferase [Phycisphaerae bacterium]